LQLENKSRKIKNIHKIIIDKREVEKAKKIEIKTKKQKLKLK